MTVGSVSGANRAHAARVHVRPATPADLPVLFRLWDEAHGSVVRSARDAWHLTLDDAREHLPAAVADPTCQVVVATRGDEVQGMAVLNRTPLGPLSSTLAVQLNHVVVAGGRRRHGVGHALVAAATAYAEEVGAEHVLVSVSPGLRDANRFYARLGFSPVVVRRIAPVPVLRRRLADYAHPVAAMEQLTRRRLLARPGARNNRRRFTVGGPTG